MEAPTLALAHVRAPGRPHATDDDLVAATRRGDDRAFEQLYARYHRRIAAYVFGMVKDHQRAEDVTQEIFLSALRRMRRTDRPIAFKPWVYEIAKNACIDHFRRSRRAEEVSYDADDGIGPTMVSKGPTPDVALEGKQQLDDLRGAFGGLSESHHRILVMRELEGLTYAEIGARMGMTKPSVESTLFRARKRLSEEYEELISGERCRRVQAIIAAAQSRALGARDQRRMARHVSHCQPCRRAAALAGIEDVAPAATGVRAKIAGLLPVPALLRDWLHLAAPAADSSSAGWMKALATAASVAAAGVGANAVTGVAPAIDRPPGPAAALAAVTGHDNGDEAGAAVGDLGEARPRPVAIAPRRAAPEGRPASSTAARAGAQRTPHASVGPAPGAGAPAASSEGASRASAGGPAAATAPVTDAAAGPARATTEAADEGRRTLGDAVRSLPIVGSGSAPSAPAVPSAPSPPPVRDTAPQVPQIADITKTADQTSQQAGQAVGDLTDGLRDRTTRLADTLAGG